MIISKINDTNTQRPNYKTIIGGVSAGILTKSMLDSSKKVILGKVIDKVGSFNRQLSYSDVTLLNRAAEKILYDTNLKKAGVEILDANKHNAKTIQSFLAAPCKKSFLYKLFPKFYNKEINRRLNNYLIGKNAGFFRGVQKIVVARTKHSLSFFHEIGHAINYNFSPFWKKLQKQKGLRTLVLPILSVALFTNKKQENEKTKGIWDKTTHFIKNNAGKLSFLTFLPVLAEEVKASIRANKLVKTYLPPQLAKTVAKSNAYCYSTYLISAGITSLGVYLANKVRDKIVT